MKADKKLIEKVAKAIERTSFGSRYNDWTSDHVPGWPIEITDFDRPEGKEVVKRYRAHVGESEALRRYERTQKAIAALKAAGFEVDEKSDN